MPDTLGSLRAEIVLWLRGDLTRQDDVPLLNTAINDAIDSIWMAMMQVQLARFLGVDSPVTFTLPAGAERVQLVSIPDPTQAPVLGQTGGGQSATPRTILVGYTYVTESGSETQLSPTATLVVNPNNLGQVTPPAPLPGAFGWNCYVSVSNTPGLMALQNQNPLPFSALFTESVAPGWQDYSVAQQQPPIAQIATGVTPAGSPPPSENSTADNISWISHLEVRTSDTLLRSWNQYELDSEIMRRYARTLSSASEFQTYVWDLINGNRLEVRPAAGLTFTPRYFYIAKPRRLRYDQANIPYLWIPGVRKFLRCQSIADLKLPLDEYLAQQGFAGAAQQEKADILKSLRMEDWNKNTRVQPHLF